MKPALRIAVCTLAAFSLSGCQSFVSALGFGPKDSKSQRAEASTSVFGQDELEQGRLALKAGYPANAIKLFRLAALDEASAPDAFNGLGVAYAKLGRADLAERYFKMAVSLDGTNPKFAANLDRFYNSALGNSQRALAMREKEAQQQLAAAAQAAEAQGLLEAPVEAVERRGALTIEKAPTRMTRLSNREIRLTTTTTTQENRGGAFAAVDVRNPVKKVVEEAKATEDTEAVDAAPAGNKPTEISMIGNLGKERSYPVRISLTKPQTGKAAPTPRRNYPLRVALSPSQVSE